MKPITKAIYPLLKTASETILQRLGCQPEPTLPVNRTKKWAEPRGICYHYTGGPSGVRTAQWFNHPDWGNSQSSAHVLIFDRLTDDLVGRNWANLIPEEVRYFFPVPTLILSDWSRATWCSNWANGYCLGVENRNVGYNVAPRGEHSIPGKVPWISSLGANYEPYTREQIVCNISIGQLFKAFFPGFNPDYVLGHHGVWAEKSDPGPHFPLIHVRQAIVDNVVDFKGLPWISLLPHAPHIPDSNTATEWSHSKDKRDTACVPLAALADSLDLEGLESDEMNQWLRSGFLSLGYNAGEGLTPEKTRLFTWFFQQSTKAYEGVPRKKSRMLTIDGVPGPVTRQVMFQRLIDLKVVVRMPPSSRP